MDPMYVLLILSWIGVALLIMTVPRCEALRQAASRAPPDEEEILPRVSLL